jgi:hypothetical protein
MPQSLTETLDDQEFRKMSPDAQKLVLKHYGVSDDMQGKLLSTISQSPAATTPAPQKSFMSRFSENLGTDLGAMANFPAQILDSASKKVKEAKAQGRYGKMLLAPFEAEEEGIANAGKGILSMTTPGIAYRMSQGEDPAKISADAATFLAGDEAGGETPGKIAEGTVGKTMDRVGGATRALAQDVAGAGKIPVAEAERARAHKVETQQAGFTAKADTINQRHAQDLVENERKTQELLDTHQEKLKDAKAKYDQEVAAHEQATAGQKSAHAKKVADAQKDWVDKAYAAEKSAQDAEAIKNKREALGRGQEAYTKMVKDNVDKGQRVVKGKLDARWDAIRDKIGEETPTDATTVHNAVQKAIKNDLRGAPGSVKVFNDLLTEIGIKDSVDDAEGLQAAPGASIPWQTARVHYSAVGDRLAQGDLPGNIYQALKHVHEAQDAALQATAKRHGIGDEYSSLKADQSRYYDDWEGKDSPLAKIRNAKDAADISSQVLGKAGDRLLQTMAKYRDAGVSPHTALALRRMNAQAEALPKIKVSAKPGKFEMPAPPKFPEPPELGEVKPPKLPDKPTLPTLNAPKDIPPVDPREVRLRKLESVAGRPYGWWDLFPPRLAEHLLLSNKKVREWIASQPRQELPAGSSFPPPPSQ